MTPSTVMCASRTGLVTFPRPNVPLPLLSRLADLTTRGDALVALGKSKSQLASKMRGQALTDEDKLHQMLMDLMYRTNP